MRFAPLILPKHRSAVLCIGTALPLAMVATTASAQIAAPADPKLLPMVELTLVVNGPGEVRGAGPACKVPLAQTTVTCKRLVPKDKPLTLEPIAPANTTMTGWTGSCGGVGRCLLVPTANFGATASFAAAKPVGTATVTIAIPVGGGSVKTAPFVSVAINCERPIDGTTTGTCTATVPVGTKIELFTKADPHAKFAGWESAQPGCQQASCVFDVSQSTTLTAKFQVPRFQRTIYSTTGMLNSVGLTTPTPGAFFKCGLSGGGFGSGGYKTCQLTAFADGPATIEATFSNGTKVNGQMFFLKGCKEIVANTCVVLPSLGQVTVR